VRLHAKRPNSLKFCAIGRSQVEESNEQSSRDPERFTRPVSADQPGRLVCASGGVFEAAPPRVQADRRLCRTTDHGTVGNGLRTVGSRREAEDRHHVLHLRSDSRLGATRSRRRTLRGAARRDVRSDPRAPRPLLIRGFSASRKFFDLLGCRCISDLALPLH
jgi:hypothetical protein